MPELGWSVSEALFMPLLLKFNVPASVLAICWLFSPVLGLFMHPCIGDLSDRHGRRPFIVSFGLVAVVGLISLPLCTSFGSSAAAVAIVAYGLTDISHDLLLTPTRAAMNDVFVDADECEKHCARSASFGKILGTFCASALPGDLAFFVVAAFMAAASLAQLVAPKEPAKISPPGEMGCFGPSRPPKVPAGFRQLWAITFAGYVICCTVFFFLTSAWAQRQTSAPAGSADFESAVRVATALLLGNAVLVPAANMLLPCAVRLCGGELGALAFSVLVFDATALSFVYAPVPVCGAAIVFALPLAYQILFNVPFTWIERQDDFNESDRGVLTGRLNAALSAGQGCTAVFAGPIVAASGGTLTAAYVAAAAASAGIVLVAGVSYWCCSRSGVAARQTGPGQFLLLATDA